MNLPTHPLVQLARRALEAYLSRGEILSDTSPLGPEGQARAGVFVSLKKQGKLRGCIGTFLPTTPNVAQEVIHNAIAAATRDPRFPPVSLEELPEIRISVDVLSPPEPVSSLQELDPKRYGVIVESGGRRGLLLPDLEGIDTPEQQVQIAKNKAGIYPDEPVQLYRFTVQRYQEED